MEDGGAGLRESRAAEAHSGTRRGSRGAPTLLIQDRQRAAHNCAFCGALLPSAPPGISPARDRGGEESTHRVLTRTDLVSVRLARLGICVVRRLGRQQRLPILYLRASYFGRLPWNAATAEVGAEQRCLGYGLGGCGLRSVETELVRLECDIWVLFGEEDGGGTR